MNEKRKNPEEFKKIQIKASINIQKNWRRRLAMGKLAMLKLKKDKHVI